MTADRHPLPAPSPLLERRLPDVPMPSYRYVPGLQPHPHKHAGGHRHAPELSPADLWLHGLDLFDHRFYWECHEVLEGRWKELLRTDPRRDRLQGVIQLAAACLQAHMGHPAGARRLADKGAIRLRRATVELGDRAAGGMVTEPLIAAVLRLLDGGPWPVVSPL
jgi:predicted metal-dependent hydrolase